MTLQALSTPDAIRRQQSGELTQSEIERGQVNAEYRLSRLQKAPISVSRTKGPRYTPVSKRQDKPDGIAWILRNHSEISDAQARQADRHNAQHHCRNSRSQPLEHRRYQPQGPGHLAGLRSQREA